MNIKKKNANSFFLQNNSHCNMKYLQIEVYKKRWTIYNRTKKCKIAFLIHKINRLLHINQSISLIPTYQRIPVYYVKMLDMSIILFLFTKYFTTCPVCVRATILLYDQRPSKRRNNTTCLAY